MEGAVPLPSYCYVFSSFYLKKIKLGQQILGNKPEISTDWQRHEHLFSLHLPDGKFHPISRLLLFLLCVSFYLPLSQPEDSMAHSSLLNVDSSQRTEVEQSTQIHLPQHQKHRSRFQLCSRDWLSSWFQRVLGCSASHTWTEHHSDRSVTEGGSSPHSRQQAERGKQE